VGRVAEQGDAGDALPPVPHGQDVQWPVEETAVAAAEELQQAVAPAGEHGAEVLAHRRGIVEVDACGDGPVGRRRPTPPTASTARADACRVRVA
jgi:hypothetical protein